MLCSVMGVLGAFGAGNGMIPFVPLDALGEAEVAQGTRGSCSHSGQKVTGLGQGTGERVEWTPQKVDIESIGLEDG